MAPFERQVQYDAQGNAVLRPAPYLPRGIPREKGFRKGGQQFSTMEVDATTPNIHERCYNVRPRDVLITAQHNDKQNVEKNRFAMGNHNQSKPNGPGAPLPGSGGPRAIFDSTCLLSYVAKVRPTNFEEHECARRMLRALARVGSRDRGTMGPNAPNITA